MMRPDNRLLWRCRRGLLELDIVLQRFLDLHYADLGATDRAAFADLVELQDIDLWHLLTADTLPSDAARAHVLGMLRRAMQDDIGNDQGQQDAH
jgi:antitoxin CptB